MMGGVPSDCGSIPTASVFSGEAAGLLRARILEPPRHPGQIGCLGRFDILRVIGSGGMGVVLLARDSSTLGLVAIKVLRPEFVDRTDVRHRFLVEARHMQNLSHPNILTLSEISDRAEGPYFVMPFIENGSLAGKVRPGQPLEPEMVLRVALQVANALVYAHSKGIIHRDLKPGNILVDGASEARLTDFGLARRFDVNDSMVDVTREQCEGTCPYMSPEVASGKAGDTRCDIYAFGATLYELLTERPPYSGSTAESILGKISSGPPEPILKRAPQAHAGLTAVAEGAMARELRDRYASMGDVATDLERIMRGEEPLGPRGQSRRWPAPVWQVAAVAVVLVACVLGLQVGLGIGHRKPAPQEPKQVSTKGATVLLDEEFRGTTIDASRWTWGENHASIRESQGKHYAHASQQDGTLLMEARVEHESGAGSVQTAWLDSTLDLQGNANNIVIDVRFSASAVGGGIAVMLSNGEAPQRWPDPNSVVLFRASATGKNALNLKEQRVQIEILKAARLAVVGPMDGISTRSQLVDIPELSALKLRFSVFAMSSTESAPSDAQLRLRRVTVSTVPPQSFLVGKVVDSCTNRPVSGVTVRTTSIPTTVDTDAQGNFILPSLPVGRVEITGTTKDYAQLSGPLVVDVAAGKPTVVRIVMRRLTPPGYGEVAESVPLDSGLLGLAVTDRWVYFTGSDQANGVVFYRMARSGDPRVRVTALPGRWALAAAKGELYGLDRLPGRLYKIGPDGKNEKVRDVAMSRPQGLAFDGALFWSLEVNPSQNVHTVCSFDPNTGELKTQFASADEDIRTIAAEGNPGRRLWIAGRSGVVYEVDPRRIPPGGKMEDGVLRKFPGYYNQLSWWNNELWGADNDAKRLCRIVIQDVRR